MGFHTEGQSPKDKHQRISQDGHKPSEQKDANWRVLPTIQSHTPIQSPLNISTFKQIYSQDTFLFDAFFSEKFF